MKSNGQAKPCDCSICCRLYCDHQPVPRTKEELEHFREHLDDHGHNWSLTEWSAFLQVHFPKDYYNRPQANIAVSTLTLDERLTVMTRRYESHCEIFHPKDKLGDKVGLLITVLRNGRIEQVGYKFMGQEEGGKNGNQDGADEPAEAGWGDAAESGDGY